MKLHNLEIQTGEKVFRFRGVFDIRINKTLTFSKPMKQKGVEYKIRYCFDLEKFKDGAIIVVGE